MLAALLVLLQLGAPTPAGRPAECGFGEGARPNVWERVKQPELGKYCDLLASGASKLAGAGTQAREVLAIADEADKRLPGHTAPMVLRGRAYVKLVQYTDAYGAFGGALAKDPSACDDPIALYAYARAASRTGHDAEARTAFRALLPRASVLPSLDRGAAYVEAGMLTMAGGATSIDDAVAIFRQARREAQDSLGNAAWLGLALALDRAGLKDESRAVLAERSVDPRAGLGDSRVREVLAPVPKELDALAALGLEATDAAAAQASWHKYVEASAGGPWVEHAKAREAALGAPSKKVKPR